jgi:hypothetical protein
MSFEVLTVYDSRGKNITDILAEFETYEKALFWLKGELKDPFYRDAQTVGIANKKANHVNIAITVDVIFVSIDDVTNFKG